jgi:type VI secretion system secreted protein VgrG
MVDVAEIVDGAAAALGAGGGGAVFDLTVGPVTGVLRVVSFRGRERLSKLFAYEILALGPPELDLIEAGILALPAALTIRVPGGVPRVVMGIVTAIEPESATVHQGLHAVRISLRPTMWRLKKRITSRIFQGMSVPEIILTVLADGEVAARTASSRDHAKRDYCVQYQESDYAFVKRLSAEEGLMWYFEPPSGALDALSGGASAAIGAAASAVGGVVGAAASALGLTETVVFIDDPAGYPPMAGGDPIGATVDVDVSIGPGGIGASASVSLGASPHLRLRTGASAVVGDDDVEAFGLRSAVASDAVLLRDYDFERPQLDLRAEAAPSSAASASASLTSSASLAGAAKAAATAAVGAVVAAVTGATSDGLRVYEHRGDYAAAEADAARAAVVLDEYRRRAVIGGGRSTCRRMSPGSRFFLDSDDFPLLVHEYVVTEVEHEGRSPELAAASAHAEHLHVYSNSFRCVPATVAYRPKRPRRRVIQVMESAKVVGPSGEDIYTDEFGRIKVQFPWDLAGKSDEHSSCWMRVIERWGGASWGTQFIPRVGMEVLVAFLAGDQDCPVVVGSAYNATHPAPFRLPQDKTRSGIRTQTTPGGKGFNELSFEDAVGAEQVYVHAQRDLDELVERNHGTDVRQSQSTSVGVDQTVVVHQDRRVKVDRDLSEEIGKDRAEKIAGDRTVSVTRNRRAAVAGDDYVSVAGNRSVAVDGDLDVHVGAHHGVMAGDAKTPGVIEQFSWGTFTIGAKKELIINAMGGLKMICGDNAIELGDDGLVIRAKNVSLEAKESLSAKGKGPALVLSDAAALSAKTIKLVSSKGSISLDDQVNVQGQKVLLNCQGVDLSPSDDPAEPPKTQKLHLVMQDPDFAPYAGKPYILTCGGVSFEGTTGGDGAVEQDVPSGATHAELVLYIGDRPEGEQRRYMVTLGETPDATSARGALVRLANLGYFWGPIADDLDDRGKAALATFQEENGLPATGELDGATSGKLGEVHGH